ncbi:MAG: DUF992 domain-containing protein [Kiloniellales bacterium]
MRKGKLVSAGLAVAAALAFALPLPALGGGGVKVGVLHCKNVPGTRSTLLIRSSVEITCKFETPGGTEYYRGETGIALGVDLNVTKTERMAYTVLMATGDTAVGAYSLEGKYYGAKASATAGGGVGASVLIGGGRDSVTLQPLALEGSYGLGVAGGLGYLYLERDPGRR